MSDFETDAELSLTVPSRELRNVRQQIESGIGTVEVGVTDGGSMSAQAARGGGAAAGGSRERRWRRREHRWARDRTEHMADAVLYLEDIEDKVGEDGGLGGGILNSIIGLGGEAGGAAVGALGTGAAAGIGAAVGTAIANALSNNSVSVEKPEWVPITADEPEWHPLEITRDQYPLEITEDQYPLEITEEQYPLQITEEQYPLEITEDQYPLRISEDQYPLRITEEQYPLEISEEQYPLEISNERLPLAISNERLPLAVETPVLSVAAPEYIPVRFPEMGGGGSNTPDSSRGDNTFLPDWMTGAGPARTFLEPIPGVGGELARAERDATRTIHDWMPGVSADDVEPLERNRSGGNGMGDSTTLRDPDTVIYGPEGQSRPAGRIQQRNRVRVGDINVDAELRHDNLDRELDRLESDILAEVDDRIEGAIDELKQKLGGRR